MLNNKKILFVIPRMGGGGAERVTAIIANAMSKNGNNVSIYTLVGGESFYPLNPAVCYDSVNITVNRKNKITTFFSEAIALPKSIYSVWKLIKNERYDIVISFLVETDIIVGLCKLFGLKFKHVCSERNDPSRRSKQQLFILNKIYRNADLFICQSKSVAKFYKAIPKRIKTVIPNPINSEDIPKRPTKISKRIVGIGRLTAQKNFPLLIKSFANIHNEFPEYILEIYGEGECRGQLESLIKKLNMSGRVILKGACQDVQTLVSDAALFVLSSDYEGFPNVLLEAIAIGLPVISTDFATGVARELIGDENGIIVPVGDEKLMTGAIRELLGNDEKRKKMEKNNQEKGKYYYKNRIVEKWDEALEGITKTDYNMEIKK